jgi:signal transduction histidine kinase
MYLGIATQLDRISEFQKFDRQDYIRINPLIDSPMPPPPFLDPKSAKDRIFLILLMVNGVVFCLSGGAGYALAGRTLRPIKEMMDEQSRFITDASHELKTPLTAMRTEFEVAMLEKNMSKQQSEKLIKSSYEEIINLQGLAENLLELTQQQKKHDNLKLKDVSLLEVTEAALRKVIPLAKQKHITINNLVDDYLLRGEEQSLAELFVILLDNAIKYSSDTSEVKLTSKKTDHHLMITISDNGIGIAQKDRLRIFDRFYRADKSRSITAGYGLGLSIAKEIIESHRGSVSVESEVNHGTDFIIKFPLSRTS